MYARVYACVRGEAIPPPPRASVSPLATIFHPFPPNFEWEKRPLKLYLYSEEMYMNKPSNEFLEMKKITPTPAKTHRKWKNIARELSDLSLTLVDLDPMTSDKPRLAAALMQKHDITIGELILIRQAYKAMEEGDTRAAEFFRDTMGENPKQVIEVQKNPLSQMSDEEIQKKLEELEELQNSMQDPTDE